jgi:ATP-binding cassette subfamily F protein uup
MLVNGSNITKFHADSCILDDISFNIENNDKIAILGVNGTGKTTLLNIIAKNSTYDGKIIYKKNIKISYLSQNPIFDLNTNVNDIINELKKDKDVNDYQIKAILNKLGIIEYDKPLNQFSGGQLKRVSLAITLLKPCDLLILDEPTNHLDNTMIDYLEKYLVKFNKALLLVTHDRYFLERIINKIYEIDKTQIYEYTGNYTKYIEKKSIREEQMLVSQDKRKKFLKKELEWVHASPSARSTKQKARLQRFDELNNTQNITESGSVQIIDASTRLGKKTIELKNVAKSFDDLLLFNNFSYIFKKTDRIGILGDNGVGKTTLLNIITKNLKTSSGEVIYGETVKLGYFKQGIDDMDLTLKVIDYIKESAQFFNTDNETLSATSLLNRFLFDKNLQHTYISRLSGGQKRRLYLLKVLMNKPNVLILDEPTNDLDIETLQILEDYLDSFNGIVITVSHDRYFLDRICTGLFILKDKQIYYLNGGYSNYIDTATSIQQNTKNKNYIKNHQVKLSYKEQKEFDNLEKEIEITENKISKIEDEMNHTTDYNNIIKLTNQRNSLNKDLEINSDRYFELLEIIENSKS